MTALGLLRTCALLFAAFHLGIARADAITFTVQLPKEAARYTALLQFPGAACMAMENAGLQLSLVDTLSVGNGGRSVSVRNLTLEFRSYANEQAVFEASTLVGIEAAGSRLSFPVIVDLRSVGSGTAKVSLLIPGAKLIPPGLVDKLQTKLQQWSSPEVHKRIFDYLSSLSIDTVDKDPIDSMVRQIMADGYNRRALARSHGGNAGEAIPLSDQWMLILSLAIWLIAVPVTYLVRRRRSNV